MAQFRKDLYQYLPDSKTLFETVMIADQYGNLVGAANPSGMAVDAFGRARTSAPLTLFDSQHRYVDNGKVNTVTTTGGSFTHNANTSMIEMTVNSTTGAEVKRETTRVFAYQPGKSLQVLITFVMNSPKSGLRQRAGLFGEENGIYIEQDNDTIYIVKRTKTTGSIQNIRVPQSEWSLDKLDGAGPSKQSLDLTKAQIFFFDIEWLGVGSVRAGFVIDGHFIHCHTFNHANVIDSTYMTTATLPGRVEITNTGGMTGTATYKQACFTVISEGGYELRGRPRGIQIPITTPRTLTTAGTFYPVVSIRLKSSRLDSVAVLKNIHVLGTSNTGRYGYKVVSNAEIAAGTWVPASDDSSVEYNISGTSMTGGIDLLTGYTTVSNQSAPVISLDSGIFKFQLERNSFTSTPYTITLAVAGGANSDTVLGGMDWEEVV
jgi:hypothetical protein